MDLAIIIVSWNVRQLLQRCLISIHQSLSTSGEHGRELSTKTWVVDNHSSDGTPELVRERFPHVRLIANSENKGFAAANNQAIEEALRSPEPRFLLLLNPDTAVHGQALETLIHFMDETPAAGMAGARLVYADGSFQHSAFDFPGLAQIILDLFPLPARLHETRLNGRYPRDRYAASAPPFRVAHPLGAAMMVRREVVETVGPLDADYFMYCEEIDWAMRIRAAGWQIYCVPEAEIVHHGGQSTSQLQADSFANLWTSRHRLYHKHYAPLNVSIASILVRAGMKVKIRQTDSAELKAAFTQVHDLWSSS